MNSKRNSHEYSKEYLTKKFFNHKIFIIFILIIADINLNYKNTKNIHFSNSTERIFINQNNIKNITKELIFTDKDNNMEAFLKYVNDSKNLKNYKRERIKNEIPYLSVCISALNMEKYIERTVMSIINQIFPYFEIIIVNDFSQDNTENIIKRLQSEDDRIKLINHNTNLGVYRGRMEGMLNAKGKYILLMDPDDMILNEELYQKLYIYNLKLNLDIIEFSVYEQFDGQSSIYIPNNHFILHYHNFDKPIIYQPELSEILFHDPNTHKYSKTICRNVWNKIIRKELFLKIHAYIGDDYYSNQFVITADDMLMNIIGYNFASNYSNIKLVGYLYNIRSGSMSHGRVPLKIEIARGINYYLYFSYFYNYLKDFKKDRNFLFYEMLSLPNAMNGIKNKNITEFMPKVIKFINEMLNDKNISSNFQNFLKEKLIFFKQ